MSPPGGWGTRTTGLGRPYRVIYWGAARKGHPSFASFPTAQKDAYGTCKKIHKYTYNFGWENSLSPLLAQWGNENGLPAWNWKSLKNIMTKVAYQAANDSVWMPQALKPLCLIQFWSWLNYLFPLLALWGNKNWPPSMKVQKLKIFWNKMSSKGCKWSSLNGPGTENPLSHSILKLAEFPSSIIGPRG